MWRGARALVLAALALLAGPSLASKKYSLTIGYLPSITGEMRDRQGLTISGALSMALDDVCRAVIFLFKPRLCFFLVMI